MKAVCRYCGLKLTSTKRSGTNSLRNHVAESCPRITDAERKRFVATMKDKAMEGSFTFDPRRTRELLVKWCISAKVAFNKFDDPFFAPLIQSLQPSFNGVGRQTMCNDSVGRYQRIKEELRNELGSLDSTICFTSDIWTSNQKLGYICLTAHYIDASFVLKKKIIAFKDIKYPHTGLAIEDGITKCLIEWGIKDKVFTITLDNASNNMSACDHLRDNGGSKMFFGGEHLHIRCCAHILNLLVQDGMKVADDAIDLVRELVRHINSSPSRIQAFNEIAQRSGLPSKAGLVLDVLNRWNSTYYMIMEAIQYKVVLKHYAEAQLELCPEDEEWKKAKAIGEFLGAFEEATKAFSAHRTPTAHLFMSNVLCVHQALRNRRWQVDHVLDELAAAMDDKFDKYWDQGKYNMALVIATILDPSKKISYLQFFYEKTCRVFDDIETSLTLARTWFTKYFEEYEKLVRKEHPNSSQVGTTPRTLGSPVLGKRRLDDEFAQWSQIRRRRAPKSELEAYLEEEITGCMSAQTSKEDKTDWRKNEEKTMQSRRLDFKFSTSMSGI
ncbi:hypothetical protein QOZ80_9AG0690210 [Eleusine coracana subsp. coracana]|nr:hypothetical protein QOZ80_9AG0690210 [Eleusine coracana subsp. coracana]